MYFEIKYTLCLLLCLILLMSAEQIKQDIHDIVRHEQGENDVLVNRMNIDEEKYSDKNINSPNKPLRYYGQQQLVSSFRANNVSQLLLENFRNPCWLDEEQENLKCLPYFFLIDLSGQPPFLYKTIAMHPLIFDAKLKRPGFWNNQRYTAGYNSLDFYTSLFEHATTILRRCTSSNSSKVTKCTFKSARDYTSKDYHPGITCDPNSETLHFNFAAHNKIIKFSKEKLLPNDDNYNPDLVHRIHPKARFIIMVKNPVQRLYEVYNKVYRDPSPAYFHAKVYRAVQWFINCKRERRRDSDWCFFMTGSLDNDMSKFVTEMQKGFYYSTLSKWTEHFPDDNFKIFKYEDYIEDQKGYLESIFHFLGLRSFRQLEDIVKHPTHEASPVEPMWNATTHLLHALYQPFNDELSYYMDDNRFRYLDRAGCSLKVEKLFALL